MDGIRNQFRHMHTYLRRNDTDQLILPQGEIGIAVAGQIDCLFEKGDNSCNLILSFANPSGNSLKVYVLFDLVT